MEPPILHRRAPQILMAPSIPCVMTRAKSTDRQNGHLIPRFSIKSHSMTICFGQNNFKTSTATDDIAESYPKKTIDHKSSTTIPSFTEKLYNSLGKRDEDSCTATASGERPKQSSNSSQQYHKLMSEKAQSGTMRLRSATNPLHCSYLPPFTCPQLSPPTQPYQSHTLGKHCSSSSTSRPSQAFSHVRSSTRSGCKTVLSEQFRMVDYSGTTETSTSWITDSTTSRPPPHRPCKPARSSHQKFSAMKSQAIQLSQTRKSVEQTVKETILDFRLVLPDDSLCCRYDTSEGPIKSYRGTATIKSAPPGLASSNTLHKGTDCVQDEHQQIECCNRDKQFQDKAEQECQSKAAKQLYVMKTRSGQNGKTQTSRSASSNSTSQSCSTKPSGNRPQAMMDSQGSTTCNCGEHATILQSSCECSRYKCCQGVDPMELQIKLELEQMIHETIADGLFR